MKLPYGNHRKLLSYLTNSHKAIQKEVKIKSGTKYKLSKNFTEINIGVYYWWDITQINLEALQVPCSPTCTQYEPQAHYRHWLNIPFLHTQNQASNMRNTNFNFMYSILSGNLPSWYSETMTLFMPKFRLLHVTHLWTLSNCYWYPIVCCDHTYMIDARLPSHYNN